MLKSSDRPTFHRFRSFFFFGMIAVLTILLLLLFRPFFYPIFWAGVITILFHPVYAGFNRILRLPAVSAFLTMIVAVVVIFLPLSILAVMIVHESIRIYALVSAGNFLLQIQGAMQQLAHTPIGPYISQVQGTWTNSAADATKTIALFAIDHISAITKNSIRFLFLLFITLYTLFFFLKDGGKILQGLKHYSPLDNVHEELLFARFISTLRATIKSTFLIGGIQGILAGILFSVADVQGALLWAVILFFLSMIPGVGAVAVWLPLGIITLALGHTWQGVLILAAGGLLLSTVDNLLRPPLIGKDTQMHPLLVLFSSLGGILLFGIAGFVIGPIIAALYLSIMAIYEDYYRQELTNGRS